MKELFPNYYITETGEFYSTAKNYVTPKKLTVSKHPKNGYGYICLGKNGKMRAHRLVAETYIPNPNNLPEVNHKDRDKMNNRVENLEWMSRQQNAEHALSKYYIVEHIESGEEFEIFNLSAFCRTHGLRTGSLHDTLKQRQGCKQHRGWRISQRHTRS